MTNYNELAQMVITYKLGGSYRESFAKMVSAECDVVDGCRLKIQYTNNPDCWTFRGEDEKINVSFNNGLFVARLVDSTAKTSSTDIKTLMAQIQRMCLEANGTSEEIAAATWGGSGELGPRQWILSHVIQEMTRGGGDLDYLDIDAADTCDIEVVRNGVIVRSVRVAWEASRGYYCAAAKHRGHGLRELLDAISAAGSDLPLSDADMVRNMYTYLVEMIGLDLDVADRIAATGSPREA